MSEHNPPEEKYGADAHPGAGSLLARRRRWSWVVVGSAVLLAFACGMALQQVRSPEQAALDAAAPPRTVLTAPVTRELVSASVVGRGSVVASAPVAVPLPAPGDGGRVLVSATPVQVGGTVGAGDVVVAVSGRPIIALHGAIPSYRDLRPGDQGGDVTQFQQAVAELGFTIEVDGQFGEQTKAAVRWLYDRAGYQTPSTTGLGEPDDPTVTAARTTLRQAERQVSDLQRQITQAQTGSAPAAEASAPVDVSAQIAQLADAQQDVGAAQGSLAQAIAVSGPILPMGEVTYVPTLPAQLIALSGAPGATPTDPVATLNSGDLVVSAPFDPAQAAQLREGMAVALLDETFGWAGTGSVTSVGQAQATDENPTPSSTVTIVPNEPIPGELTGANLKVTVTEASTQGEVLAVPIAAITASADGSTYVVRVDADGDQTKIVVTTGVNGNGLVEVAPVDGDLAEGDRVVTGQ